MFLYDEEDQFFLEQTASPTSRDAGHAHGGGEVKMLYNLHLEFLREIAEYILGGKRNSTELLAHMSNLRAQESIVDEFIKASAMSIT